MKFKVIREHIGDKMYRAGDVREVDAHCVTHLVKKGVLVPIIEELKVDGGVSSDKASSDAGVVDSNSDAVTKHASGSDADASANHSMPDAGSADSKQSKDIEVDPALNKSTDPAKSDSNHKNKAEPAAPKNKGQ